MLRTSTYPLARTLATKPVTQVFLRPSVRGFLSFPSLYRASPATTSKATKENPSVDIPFDIALEVAQSHPEPMREWFKGKPKTTEELEALDIGLKRHRVPQSLGDKTAYYVVQMLRYLPDTYFRNNHYMRVVMLETVAAVPGMVGAMLRHFKSLRKIKHDGGWIFHLLHEAENERMHLLTFLKLLQPSRFDRFIVLAAQGIFANAYFFLYLISPRTAHRFCGYLEEEAVISYTHFLNDIDNNKIENGPAPQIAIEYWNLHPESRIRDVVLAIRSDEALHRDSNHLFADRIATHQEDLRSDAQKVFESPEWKSKLHSGVVEQNADLKWGRKEAL